MVGAPHALHALHISSLGGRRAGGSGRTRGCRQKRCRKHHWATCSSTSGHNHRQPRPPPTTPNLVPTCHGAILWPIAAPRCGHGGRTGGGGSLLWRHPRTLELTSNLLGPQPLLAKSGAAGTRQCRLFAESREEVGGVRCRGQGSGVGYGDEANSLQSVALNSWDIVRHGDVTDTD